MQRPLPLGETVPLSGSRAKAAVLNPKIVIAHNYYQNPGGEDEVFRTEASLLEARGHEVVRYSMHNSGIPELGGGALVKATLWNSAVYRDVGRLLREESPYVIHFHNTFPLMSPAAYYAARKVGVPVVQTLHNYRLICPNGLLFRNAQPCERCVGKAVAWPGAFHACYRQSRAATTVTAAMLAVHRAVGTWTDAVDMYIALTEFSRRKFIEGGIPEDRLVVKPNCLSVDPGVGRHNGDFALFVGRLSHEKGVHTLLRAWKLLSPSLRLKVVGDGPLSSVAVQSGTNVEWLGHLMKDQVFSLMREAAFLVVPSDVYENCPLTVLEAFATGLPVIATGHGALAEIVVDGEIGRLFRPGDPEDLASIVAWSFDNREAVAHMGMRARAAFEAKYTAKHNVDILMRVYRAARGDEVFTRENA